MIRLFIENQEVELNNEVTFAITKQFEDITNPTTIINDWSKTVEIPFTASNNKLFGHIYNPDKVIVDNVLNTGIYFNPLKKMNFRLEYNDAVLMQGYGKMNSITQSNGNGSYNITLFGELGKVFSEMKKITFDESTDTPDYLISGDTYFNEYITKELVYESWTSTGQTSTGLTGDFTNYIGFAPNNSFDEDFDYKTWQSSATGSTTFEESLENISSTHPQKFSDVTGVEPKTAIPNGLYPREIGEYRSYLQLPYIYFNKLFRIFQSKAESITGYQFILDDNWFTTSNPYWYDLVYMLSRPIDRKYENFTNKYEMIFSDTIFWSNSTWNESRTSNLIVRGDYYTEQLPILVTVGLDNYFHFEQKYGANINNLLLRLRTIAVYDGGNRKDLVWNDDAVMTLTLNFKDKDNNTIVDSVTYSVGSKDTNIILNAIGEHGEYYDYYYITIPSLSMTTAISKADNLQIECVMSFNQKPIDDLTNSMYIEVGDSMFTMDIEENTKSFANININKLWNNEKNLFNEILNYCKIYRIGIFVDENHKTITFKPLNRYFKNYSIVDWTDKIDKNKDFSIKPITFEDKYVMFNYEDDDTKLSKQYSEKYGVKYGEYKLITEYNFNDETQNLFEGVRTSINNSDNILSWTNLYDNNAIIYTFPAESYVYNKNDEGKNVDCFGKYYFFRGLANFDSDAQLRSVILSDDTTFQQSYKKYFYSQSYSSKSVTTYPYLSVVKGTNICLFNIPMQNYSYNTTEYNGKNSIYHNIWGKYINERYNGNNKILTCHIKLKPVDYMQFQFNQFVKIENQLYMVNKIYDYDITSEETTKVDLITIQDITGYTTNNL